MIGGIITDETGKPSKEFLAKLSKSAYQPSSEVMDLWQKVQSDYMTAYTLQHRSFREFDGVSLLTRARLDQETFAAYVGAEYVAQHKRWRWRGRKNTARNKLMGILAHMLVGLLYPMTHAKNSQNEEDKMSARVMRILVEDHLRKAKYEVKFLFMILSALVNPAVFIEVEWIDFIKKIKEQLENGEVKITDVIDEILSGLNLNIIPIDEILLCDYYSGTGQIQRLPVVLRVRRIPWDEARAKWSGKYFDEGGEDLFRFVMAGKTRIVLTGNEHQELFDIEWTEADKNYVQEITAYYPWDDLQVPFVGGVGMFNHKNPYNTNPFDHRRMMLVGEDWKTVPVLPIIMSGFEPLDPAGRFAYFKSGAFKEYWDDQALNTMHRLAHDGTYLDVFKVMFMSGVGKIDSTVVVPGGVVGMPMGATVTPYNLGPNLKAVYDAIKQQDSDMSNSTQNQIMQGNVDPNATATATNQAVQQAKIFSTVFAVFIADMVKQVGELSMDLIINHATIGELDNTVPGELAMKYKSFLIKGKEKGKNVTHKLEFTTKHMGKKFTDEQIRNKEWALYNKTGKTPRERHQSDQRIYEINPYQFARTTYTMEVDPDMIIDKSIGAVKARKMQAFNVLTDPRIAPFTEAEEVASEVIEEFGQDLADDPDKFKKKSQPNDMMGAIMGNNVPGQQGQNPNSNNFKLGGGVAIPSQTPAMGVK